MPDKLNALAIALKNLPDTPGVYLMKDGIGDDAKVIYVGKAKNLKNRVRSYFNQSVKDIKTRQLVANIVDIELRLCETEVEAFLLESELIKRYQPQFNIELKDGKTYPYLAVTQEDYPRVYITRERLEKKITYYGPFVDVGGLHESISLLQEIFKFRTTKLDLSKGRERKTYRRPCLNFSIGRCTAPCANNVSAQDYQKQISALEHVLRGRKRQLIKKLTSEMTMHAAEREYEAAAIKRDQIKGLKSLNDGRRVSRRAVRGETGMKIDVNEGLIELQHLFYLDRLPCVIEGFDISNTSGRESVASMVLFENGQPATHRYRRFRIKTVVGPDDFNSIYEVVYRRYSRLKKEGEAFPDIILIDGGLGQLDKAKEALQAVGDVPSFLLSIAKREEELYTLGREEPLLLPRHSIALRILQSVRDESHRFAQAYHKLLRKKKILGDG